MDPIACLSAPCLVNTSRFNFSLTTAYSISAMAAVYMSGETTTSLNESTCVPAGVMHEQVAIGDLYVQIVFGLAYGTVWFAGVFSNILTLIVAFSIITGRGPAANGHFTAPIDPKSNANVSEHRRRVTGGIGKPSFTVRTVFVGSLACSDLLTSMTSLPVTAVNLFTDEWPFPAFVCPGVGFLQAFSIFQSSFTFTSIAVDRFMLILYNDSPWAFTYQTARIVVGATALLAFTLASPMFAFVSVVPMPPMCGEFCVESWPQWASSIINQRTYGLFVLTLQYGLPTVVTTICYITISRYLKRRHVGRQEKLHERSKSERRASDRRRRANGMMLSMVGCFVVLWTPFNALNVLRDFGLFPYLFDWSLFGILYAVAHLIAMTSVVWNPFIYAWYNRSIRRAVLAMIHGQWYPRHRALQAAVEKHILHKRRRSNTVALAPIVEAYAEDREAN